jgi:N-acetylglutamate synthase-like GNAT family acetyltransferase
MQTMNITEEQLKQLDAAKKREDEFFARHGFPEYI